MRNLIIKLEGVTKRYGSTVAVDDLDLAIEEGEVFGLLGPNGAGKTTTILMMLGLTEPSEGKISIAGHDPLREPLKVKQRVGYLPDSVGFYDHLTGWENLRYSARLAGMTDAAAEIAIGKAFARVRLEEAGHHPVRTYSRGMRQRLGIAEIIMRDVAVAILDEPTSGLDPQTTREFLGLIRSLRNDGLTVVVSSHLLDLVQDICDRVALFNHGKIGLLGRVSDLMLNVLGGAHVIRLEARGGEIAEIIATVGGVTNIEALSATEFRIDAARDVRPEIARAINQSGGDVLALAHGAARLEDVYTRYFEEARDVA
jgi:ABC-2 type transport system ATP-binding protein